LNATLYGSDNGIWLPGKSSFFLDFVIVQFLMKHNIMEAGFAFVFRHGNT
jgi:hypothetical protein